MRGTVKKPTYQLMSLRDFLAPEKLVSSIVSVTVILVLLLGAVIMGSVLSSNPYSGQSVSVPRNEMRAPASAVNLSSDIQQAVLAAGPADTEVINLNCFNGSSPVKISSHAKQVRLRGPVCGGTDVSNVEVINRTNGFVATIFKTDLFRYSSDYIHLTNGSNQILLSYTTAQGDRHATELTISRGGLGQ